MARTNVSVGRRNADTPDLSELMSPFVGNSEIEGQLTAYQAAVSIFLEHYLTCSTPDVVSSEEKRRIALCFLKLIRSSYRPMSDLKRILCEELDSSTMRSIFNVISKRIGTLDLDLFLSLFYGCIANVVCGDCKALVKSTSPIGQFARRMLIGYKKASFSEISRLWCDVRRYFECDAMDSASNFDIPMEDSMVDNDTSCPLGSNGVSIGQPALADSNKANGERGSIIPSQKEALAFILKQISLLKRDPSSALSYAAVSRWIQKNRKHLSNLHEIHFLEYLNELRFKNLSTAESSLHRYIDCAGLTMMSKNYLDAFISDHRLTGPATNTIPVSAFRSLRYGPALLADLHRRFGNQDKALAYLQECVKNAEEANDKACLDYAVALFFTLDCAGQRAEFDRLISQALADTEERNSTDLHLRCHLAQLFKHIRDCKNAKSLTDIKHLIFTELCEKSPPMGNPGKYRNGESSERSIRNLLLVSLSSAYLQRGYWNAAQIEANKLTASKMGNSADVHSIAVTNLAYSLAAKGLYNKAKELLENSKMRFPLCTAERDRLHLAEALINFEIAFLDGNDEECVRLLFHLESLSPTEAIFRKAIYHSARDTFAQSVQLMTQFLQGDHANSPYLKCRALLILGNVYLHRATNVGLAQVYLAQCKQLAVAYRFMHLATMVDYDLMETKVLLSPSNFASVLSNLESTNEEGSFLPALYVACIGLSKVRVMLKSDCDGKTATQALDILDKVMAQLDAINSSIYKRQAVALAAVAHHRLGNTDEQNSMSKIYRELHERLRKAGFTALIF